MDDDPSERRLMNAWVAVIDGDSFRFLVTVSPEYQVVIPKDVRENPGIRAWAHLQPDQ